MKYKPVQAVHVLLYTISIGVCLMLLCSCGYSQSVYIRWSEDRKLEVSDYQVGDYDLGDAVAITTSGIKISWSGSQKRYIAYAVFNKSESYWIDSEVTDEDYVLNHEQLHFDLSHYMASLLDKEFRKKGITKDQANSLFRKYFDMLDTMQDSYDIETDHGSDRAKQSEWNVAVRNLLEDIK